MRCDILGQTEKATYYFYVSLYLPIPLLNFFIFDNSPPFYQQQQSTSVTSSPALSGMQGPGSQQMTSLPPSAASAPSLSMSQALDNYQHLSSRIDMRYLLAIFLFLIISSLVLQST